MERECFSAAHLGAWTRATLLVARVGDHWGNELRCHELSRAVAGILCREGFLCLVCDGRLHAIEHIWLFLRGAEGGAILDVYVPGRVPQVQLVHDHFVISRGYVAGSRRADIRTDIVRRLVEEMASWQEDL